MDNKRTTKNRPDCLSLAYQNFVDKKQNLFMFPKDLVFAQAKGSGAMPYDIPGAEYSH